MSGSDQRWYDSEAGPHSSLPDQTEAQPMSSGPPPIITVPLPPAAFNVNTKLGPETAELLRRAGCGDLTAQREIREVCLKSARQPDQSAPNQDILAIYGLMMARLAAAHGDALDAEKLALALLAAASRLGESGKTDLAGNYAEEALTIFRSLAAHGSKESAAAVSEIVPLVHAIRVERTAAIVAGETVH